MMTHGSADSILLRHMSNQWMSGSARSLSIVMRCEATTNEVPDAQRGLVASTLLVDAREAVSSA